MTFEKRSEQSTEILFKLRAKNREILAQPPREELRHRRQVRRMIGSSPTRDGFQAESNSILRQRLVWRIRFDQ